MFGALRFLIWTLASPHEKKTGGTDEGRGTYIDALAYYSQRSESPVDWPADKDRLTYTDLG